MNYNENESLINNKCEKWTRERPETIIYVKKWKKVINKECDEKTKIKIIEELA